MQLCLKTSFFTHVFEHSHGMLVFNGASGSIALLNQEAFSSVRSALTSQLPFTTASFTSPLAQTTLRQLVHGRFVVDASIDEVAELQKLSKLFREDRSLSVTIATTMDCNLGCYYCFEEKYPSSLGEENARLLVDYVKRRVQKDRSERVVIRWFGGEPMLNPEVIDFISADLIRFCEREEIDYSATITSNGTCWPSTPIKIQDFVDRNRIRSVQFTFDGLAENHNKRRHYVRSGASRSSFDALCQTVDALVGHVTIRLRVNCDPLNVNDLPRLADFFDERGWLFPGSGVFPYAVPVHPSTESCDFLHKFKLDMMTFSRAERIFHERLNRSLGSDEWAQHIKPRTLRMTCDAVSPNAFMMGPDGFLYRCSAEIGNHQKHHGHISEAMKSLESSALFPILPVMAPKANNFASFDVFTQPKCSTCKYLPQCMSGCPKHHLEKYRESIEDNIDANRAYWDENLGSLVRNYADTLLQGGLPTTNSVGSVSSAGTSKFI